MMRIATVAFPESIQESLGLHVPVARKFSDSKILWNIFFCALTVSFCLAYLIQVNIAASKGYLYRKAEERLDALKIETMGLEERLSMARSMQAMAARAEELGMVAPSNVEYLDVRTGMYAMAR